MFENLENLLRELEDAIQQIWTTLYPFDSEVFEIGSEEYCFYSDDFDKFGSCERKCLKEGLRNCACLKRKILTYSYSDFSSDNLQIILAV